MENIILIGAGSVLAPKKGAKTMLGIILIIVKKKYDKSEISFIELKLPKRVK